MIYTGIDAIIYIKNPIILSYIALKV